jgi:phage-related protein
VSDIGIKLGVEGEKSFKAALADINQSFRILGSEMTLVTSQFDKNDRSVESLAARNSVLNREIDTQKDKISTLQSALANAADSFGENDKRTQNWQIQLNKATAELNGMERELGDNEKALDAVGKEEKEAGDNADKLGDEVEQSGKSAEDAGGRFDKLGGILKGIGTAMGAAFIAVGAAAVTATKALTEMSVGTAAYADNILTMASVTGLSTESLQAYTYAAELVDVSIETLTGSMSKNVKSMSSATDSTKGTGAAYAKLGVSVRDANGELRSAEDVYWESIDALGKISNETERDALAMQIFGKSARDLNPLIEQGSAGIAELTEEAKRMGAVMSDEALNMAGNFDDVVQRLTAGSAAAKNALGMVLMPQLMELGTDGVDLLGDFTRGLNESGGDWTKMSAVIGKAVGGIADVILKNLPKIIDTAMGIVGAIGSAIMSNLPMLVNAASQIVVTLVQGLIAALPEMTAGAVELVLSLVTGIVENLPALVDAAVQMIATLVTGIADALPELIPAAVSAVMQIAQGLIENLPLLLDAALQLILGLTQGLLDAIPQIIEKLPAIIQAIVDFVVGAIPQIIDAGIKLLVSLVEALPEIITAIVEAIPQIIDGLITAIIGSIPQLIDAGIKLLIALIQNLPTIITTVVAAIPKIVKGLTDAIIGNIDKIIMAGVQLLVSLVENLPTIILEIVKAIPQIITGIVNAIGGLVWQLVEAGGNLLKGLWQGISDAGAWLWDKISGFFGGIMDKIKHFFGISSPSKLFRDQIGKNLALGIGDGFTDEMDAVAKDMNDAMPTSLDMPDLNAEVGYGFKRRGGFGGADSDSGGVTNNFNIAALWVREEADVHKIARELYDLQRTALRKKGVAFA